MVSKKDISCTAVFNIKMFLSTKSSY